MRRNAIRLICLGAMVLSASPIIQAVEFAGGTGEPNDPYLIATPEQFVGADFNQPGVYYLLCSDIDFEGIGPGFARDFSFRCHLNGGGHRIQHPTFTEFSGLLGWIESGATVTDLIVQDAALNLRPSESIRAVGILAAVNNGTISNCHATGWLGVPNARAVGGLVGSNGGLIKNCSFDGFVAANWAPIEPGPAGPGITGGLVGVNVGSITNCYATGTALAYTAVGGLVGSNAQAAGMDNSIMVGSIVDCYATTAVMAESGGGGLVAGNVAVITRCYATGLVTGEPRGGLIGLNDGVVTGCLWDTFLTDCRTSSGGIGFDSGDMGGPWVYAANGWVGDPNWIIDEDWIQPEYRYPRLSWEGAKGVPVPEFAMPHWPTGSGTQEDPYQIASYEDLERLGTASIFWDKHFILVNDIHYSLARTIGISRGSAFSGTLDGNGHAIHDVKLDTEGATAWNLGVFGYVTGQIRNLTVENIHFTSGPNSRWVGLLAGTCEGLIENCRASGTVTVGRDSQYIGQLVGYVGYNGGKVVDCTADAMIEAGEGSTDVGGLIGYQEPDTGRR